MTSKPATWYPSRLLSPAHQSNSSVTTPGLGLPPPPPTVPYALVILNQPINKPALTALLPHASLLVCADAGGDRYLEYFRQQQEITTTTVNTTTKDRSTSHDSTTQWQYKSRISDPSPPSTPDPVRGVQGSGRSSSSSTFQGEARLPDAIVGDLDSITPEGRYYWETTRHVEIAHDADQYSTDFTKCLKWLRRRWMSSSLSSPSNNSTISTTTTTTIGDNHGNSDGDGDDSDSPLLDVVVLGGLGGRVDQGFSQIHHLLLARSDPDLLKGRLYLLSEQSLSFVLDQGENIIHIDDWPMPVPEDENSQRQEMGSVTAGHHSICSFQESVGIIPLTGPSVVTIQGFEWDVMDWKTQFGGQVSTSNHIRNKRLMVDVQGPNACLFTVELAKHLQRESE